VRIDTPGGTVEGEARGNGTETVAHRGAMRDGMTKSGLEETETYFLTGAVVQVPGLTVAIETPSGLVLGGNVRRARHLHLRRRSLPQI
jgi:hypothetical protein